VNNKLQTTRWDSKAGQQNLPTHISHILPTYRLPNQAVYKMCHVILMQ